MDNPPPAETRDILDDLDGFAKAHVLRGDDAGRGSSLCTRAAAEIRKLRKDDLVLTAANAALHTALEDVGDEMDRLRAELARAKVDPTQGNRYNPEQLRRMD